MSIPANRLGGCHTRVARRDRLLVFSLHHDNEEDSAFVPAAEPGDPPIIDTIAERHRLAKPKELGLNVHGHSRPHTSMASMRRHSQVKTPWRLFHVFFCYKVCATALAGDTQGGGSPSCGGSRRHRCVPSAFWL